MSEYQYYEFVAIDRPLTGRQMRELRACSTRATITPARFVNTYEWGDLKADPAEWMARYFDAFLHDTNWGSRSLMFRLPRRILDLRAVKRYCPGGSASARARGASVILEFRCDEEEWQGEESSEGWLASLIPLRTDIAAGDYRALYLAWLRCVQVGELRGHEIEPPCPPGLGELSAPLGALAGFLRLDSGIVAAAAEGSRVAPEAVPGGRIRRWVAGLSDKVMRDALVHLLREDAPLGRARLLRRLREEAEESSQEHGPERRRVRQLQAAVRRLSRNRGLSG